MIACRVTSHVVQMACLLLLTCRTRADDTAADIRLIDELLASPVPAPDWRKQLSGWMKEGWTPSKVKVVAPAEDAPAEKLAEFWSDMREPKKVGIDPPSAKVVERLMEHSEGFPGTFPELKYWFDAKK